MTVIKQGFKPKVFAVEAEGLYDGYEEVVGRTTGNFYHEINLIMEKDCEVTVQERNTGSLVRRKVAKGQRVVVNKPEVFNVPVEFDMGDRLHVAWQEDPATGINKLLIENLSAR